MIGTLKVTFHGLPLNCGYGLFGDVPARSSAAPEMTAGGGCFHIGYSAPVVSLEQEAQRSRQRAL